MKRIFAIVVFALLGSGCASTKMADSSVQQLAVPSADTAQVVFLRSSFAGAAVQASVFDVTSGEAEFIGIVSNKKKVMYPVAPGEYVFMVVSEAADFMEANVVGGKRYYAIITPRMGAWKARFSMYPVRNNDSGEFQYGSDRFQGFWDNSVFSENTPESLAWAEANASSIATKYADYWAVWQSKTPADLAERTLNPADGIEP